MVLEERGEIAQFSCCVGAGVIEMLVRRGERDGRGEP